MFFSFLLRGSDACLSKVFPQLFDILLCAFITTVRMVQNKFSLIEYYAKTGAMRGLYFGAQVVKQGFNFSPVNICINGILKYCLKQV
jgi:hypothetical protein